MPSSPVLGITALVPPELVYACGRTPLDLNNFVPLSRASPRNKLCAWTATWREMLIKGKLDIDSLVVVAGGDCHNALVDGQKVALKAGLPTHYFFYPFSGDENRMLEQLDELTEFLGGVEDEGRMKDVQQSKEVALRLDEARCRMKVRPSEAFGFLVGASDLGQDPTAYKTNVQELLDKDEFKPERDHKRIAMIGVPPIYPDFHTVCEQLGLFVVFYELPYEFLRLTGGDRLELARYYADYSFARPL